MRGPNYHESLTDGSLDHLPRRDQSRPADQQRQVNPDRGASVRLATLQRHDGELRIDLDEFKGHKYVSIRTWFESGGRWCPGKGTTIKLKELDAVYDAIGKAIALTRGT